jgi:hypothetical protein
VAQVAGLGKPARVEDRQLRRIWPAGHLARWMIGIIAMFFARTWQNFTYSGVAR